MRESFSEYAPALTQSYERAHTRYLFLMRRVGQGLAAPEPTVLVPTECSACADRGTRGRLAGLLRWPGLSRRGENQCSACRFYGHYSQ